jgi:5-methyltetrahydrofolate--homocysteine methyltransferase
MDLLAAIRGPQRLCEDLIERPAEVDRAIASARALFPQLWRAMVEAGRMDQWCYAVGGYSREGSCVLSCDFSALIGPDMFRRWVLPALEEEAAIVKHATYHWDGPGALKHMPALLASRR